MFLYKFLFLILLVAAVDVTGLKKGNKKHSLNKAYHNRLTLNQLYKFVDSIARAFQAIQNKTPVKVQKIINLHLLRVPRFRRHFQSLPKSIKKLFHGLNITLPRKSTKKKILAELKTTSVDNHMDLKSTTSVPTVSKKPDFVTTIIPAVPTEHPRKNQRISTYSTRNPDNPPKSPATVTPKLILSTLLEFPTTMKTITKITPSHILDRFDDDETNINTENLVITTLQHNDTSTESQTTTVKNYPIPETTIADSSASRYSQYGELTPTFLLKTTKTSEIESTEKQTENTSASSHNYGKSHSPTSVISYLEDTTFKTNMVPAITNKFETETNEPSDSPRNTEISDSQPGTIKTFFNKFGSKRLTETTPGDYDFFKHHIKVSKKDFEIPKTTNPYGNPLSTTEKSWDSSELYNPEVTGKNFNQSDDGEILETKILPTGKVISTSPSGISSEKETKVGSDFSKTTAAFATTKFDDYNGSLETNYGTPNIID